MREHQGRQAVRSPDLSEFFECSRHYALPVKKQSSSDFMVVVTVHSDFGAQEEEICHYFHLFPLYLPCSNGTGCHDLSFFF